MPSPPQGDKGGRDRSFCRHYWGQEIQTNIAPSGLIEQLYRMRDGLLIMMTTYKLSGFWLSRRRLVFLFYALKTWLYNMQNNKRQTAGSGRSSVIQHSDQHMCMRKRCRQNLACRALACVITDTTPASATLAWRPMSRVSIWKHQLSWMWVKPYVTDEARYLKTNDESKNVKEERGEVRGERQREGSPTYSRLSSSDWRVWFRA